MLNSLIASSTHHFDVIKSLTALYDTPYYCHECKKAYTKRDKHKGPSKCLSCFTYAKNIKCEGKEIVCDKCNRKFFGKRCFKNHLKNRFKASTKGEGKQAKLTDIVCNTVKKCLDCNRIIRGKYVNNHKCGYTECNNCNKYIGKNHKCFMKKVKSKGGYCIHSSSMNNDSKKPCKNNDSIKKKDRCYSCRTYTEKYIFTISKLPKTCTGIHNVNLSIAQDFNGKEYLHNSIDDFGNVSSVTNLRGTILHIQPS